MRKRYNIYLLVTLLLTLTSCFRNIIPSDDQLEHLNTDQRIIKADELLAKYKKNAGGSVWENTTGYHLYFNDYYYGLRGKRKKPFPDKSTRFTLRTDLSNETATLEFQNGKWDNKVWGYKSDTIFTRLNMNSADIPEDNKKIKSWITYYQNFIEFPNIASKAEEYYYIGQDKYGLYDYDIVYIRTSSEIEPNETNEYLAWINRSSGLVDQIHFSIVEKKGIKKGAAFLENYEINKGLQTPELITIYPQQKSSKPFHLIRVYTYSPRFM